MPTTQDVILTVDYHLEHLEVRWLNCSSGQEQRRNILTDRRSVVRLVDEALAEMLKDAIGHESRHEAQAMGHEKANLHRPKRIGLTGRLPWNLNCLA